MVVDFFVTFIRFCSRLISILIVVFGLLFYTSSPNFGQDLLCRPWSNTVTGAEIGDSFTAKISDDVISFFGDQRPIAFAQLIYSHPLNDIFMSASGELVTAGFEGQRIRVNVYFPNQQVTFFVTSSCSKV